MQVRLDAATQARLAELAHLAGRSEEELMEEAVVSYLDTIEDTRRELARRVREIEEGTVDMIPAEEVFSELRQMSEELRQRQR